MSLIDFFVIGARRGGTNWLQSNLKNHKQLSIIMGRGNLNVYRASRIKKCVGAFDASYLSKPEAADLLFDMNKNMKIIVLLRNPIDRAYSWYSKARLGGRHPYTSCNFQEALESIPEVLEEGLYCKYLKKYYSVFPKKNILVLLHDDINSDQKGSLWKVLKFLNVDLNYELGLEEKPINKSGLPKNKVTALLYILMRNIKKGLSWMLCEQLVYRLEFSNAIVNLRNMLITQKGEKISKEIRRLLIDFYTHDVLMLQKLIGRDVMHWLR